MIECINHLPDLVEPVREEEWRLLVGVLDGSGDVTKTPQRHVGIEAEGSPVEHVNCFG